MTEEAWKPVLDYEGLYNVSDQGAVMSLASFGGHLRKKPRLLKHNLNGPYPSVPLYKDGAVKRHSIHRLVFEAFHGPIPPGLQTNHKNGIKTDNRLDNLEVCTPSQNILHSFHVLKRCPANYGNRGSINGSAKLTEADIPVIFSLAKTHRKKEIARMYGVSDVLIYRILNRQNWRHVDVSSIVSGP